MLDETFLERFWARVNKTEKCWEWLGRLEKTGYARIRRHHSRERVLVHRFSYEIHKGSIPEGLHVLHSCDNRKCVNPAHLRAGTPKENAADMLERGRANKAVGERHGNAKLSDNEAQALLDRYKAGGTTQSRLAQEYNLHPIYVNKLIKGHKRKHLRR